MKPLRPPHPVRSIRPARAGRAASLLACLAALACAPPPASNNCNGLPEDPRFALLGDSVFALAQPSCTHIGFYLGEITGSHYPDFSVGGATFRPFLLWPAIPQQYEGNAAANRPTTVILDGGGNDLYFFCQDEDLPECTSVIADIEAAFRDLVAAMRADGVENVVYLGLYPIDPASDYGRLVDTIDPWMDHMADVCDDLGVIFVDPRDAFAANPAFLAGDGMHPSALGSAELAEQIHDALVANAILP